MKTTNQGLPIILLLGFLFSSHFSAAQVKTIVSGKVTDKNTGDAVPFVNVFFYGTEIGATTDFEGRYSLSFYDPPDSLVFSYIGYKTRIVPVALGETQVINIELKPETISLQEIVISSGENPAWGIIRKTVQNKDIHDKRSLDAYEYESYTKVELDIDNISEGQKKRKLFREIARVMDSIAVLKGDDGDPYVPVFLSEALSKYYVKNSPFSRREEIHKTKISGVAIEDGSLTSQVIGAFYQEYNFYSNWMRILEKDFVSPIADGWRMYYDYDIVDTVKIGSDSCFHLRVMPNRKQDLAFTGAIWITKQEYALKQVDLTVVKAANLNFIDKIKIQQELSPTPAGPWLPSKTRVLIDVAQPTDEMIGFIAKFYNSTQNWVVNEVHPDAFYENAVIVAEDMYNYESGFWHENRHDPLTEEEVKVYEIIDTLKNVPIVKTYTDLLTTLSTGYLTLGKIDFGPFLYTYANNDLEGNRFVLAGRTNEYLSRKFYLKGYLGYGTRDENFKYGANLGIILSRRPWTEIGLRSKYDIEQVGLNSEKLDDNYIFYASTKYGELIEPYYHRQQEAYFETEIAKGLSQTVELKFDRFDPLFNFFYYVDPDNPDSELRSSYKSTSIKLATHWGRDETWVQNGNNRISLGARRAPVFDLAYTFGFDDILGSDFDFHQIEFQMDHRLRLGLAGTSRYRLNAGYILGQLPYPLLENHVGNESFFYTNGAFNTMNYSEFVSDTYVSLRYYHSFEGIILNKIPLMRKLKWRLLGTGNIIYGSLREENRQIIPETDINGTPIKAFNVLTDKPFVELGYGVENIFKIARIDFVHRLTYLDLPDVEPFRVKISFQFSL